jgi:hypothetical protein
MNGVLLFANGTREAIEVGDEPPPTWEKIAYEIPPLADMGLNPLRSFRCIRTLFRRRREMPAPNVVAYDEESQQ